VAFAARLKRTARVSGFAIGGLLAIVVGYVSFMLVFAGPLGIGECDPSENSELFDMTSQELDKLCGEDRDFILGRSSRAPPPSEVLAN